MTQIEENITQSFHLAKKDIYGLFVHVRQLYSEVAMLKKEVAMLQAVKTVRVPVIARTRYVGSMTSTKAHTDTCAYAKNIKSMNKIAFETTADARARGYALCACAK